MRPFVLGITARDFAFAAGHCCIAISLLAPHLQFRGSLVHRGGLGQGGNGIK
jgi:hypothetical protein